MASSNSQTARLTASTAASLSWAEWFDWLVISNLGSADVWLTTDGSPVAIGEAGALVVAPGEVATFANRGLKPDITSGQPGATSVNLISSAAGTVVVSPQ